MMADFEQQRGSDVNVILDYISRDLRESNNYESCNIYELFSLCIKRLCERTSERANVRLGKKGYLPLTFKE